MIILTDLDHTISDAAWRDGMIQEARETGDWDKYHTAGMEDKPILIMLDIVRYFSKLPIWSVIGLTGRNERFKKQTNMWLWKHGIVLEDIWMRPDGDRTPSPKMKVRLIRENVSDLTHIAVVLEDRDDCTKAFREIGLNVIQYHAAHYKASIE